MFERREEKKKSLLEKGKATRKRFPSPRESSRLHHEQTGWGGTSNGSVLNEGVLNGGGKKDSSVSGIQ